MASIEVDYEAVPAVFDAEAALLDDAPLVHPEWEQYEAAPILVRRGNRSTRGIIRVGDVEEGFAKSFRIFEHRFTTSKVHPGYTEPRGAIGFWDDDGSCAVWSSTQLPFAVQEIAGRCAGPALRQGAGGRPTLAAASAASCASALSTTLCCWRVRRRHR